MGIKQRSFVFVVAVSLSATVMACTSDEPDGSATDTTHATSVVTGSTAPSTAVSEATTLRGEIVLSDAGEPVDPEDFGPGAHAVVEIWRVGYRVADGPSETFATVTVEDVTSFPIPFEFPDDLGIERPQPGIDPEYEYGVWATVYLGEADDRRYAGDPFTVNDYEVVDPADELVLTVVRFEDCGDDAFGHCDGPVRPD